MHLLTDEGTCRNVYRTGELIVRVVTAIALLILYVALGARIVLLREHAARKLTSPSPNEPRRALDVSMTTCCLLLSITHLLLAVVAMTGTVGEDKQLHGRTSFVCLFSALVIGCQTHPYIVFGMLPPVRRLAVDMIACCCSERVVRMHRARQRAAAAAPGGAAAEAPSKAQVQMQLDTDSRISDPAWITKINDELYRCATQIHF
jgi:hypothetical protein